MSEKPTDEKKSSSSSMLPDMSGMPTFSIPSEMRLSRQWDQSIERFALNTATGTGMWSLPYLHRRDLRMKYIVWCVAQGSQLVVFPLFINTRKSVNLIHHNIQRAFHILKRFYDATDFIIKCNKIQSKLQKFQFFLYFILLSMNFFTSVIYSSYARNKRFYIKQLLVVWYPSLSSAPPC